MHGGAVASYRYPVSLMTGSMVVVQSVEVYYDVIGSWTKAGLLEVLPRTLMQLQMH